MLAVDPSDGCTFWATLEYMASSGAAPWRRRLLGVLEHRERQGTLTSGGPRCESPNNPRFAARPPPHR
jgi:hypothetical protein